MKSCLYITEGQWAEAPHYLSPWDSVLCQVIGTTGTHIHLTGNLPEHLQGLLHLHVLEVHGKYTGYK